MKKFVTVALVAVVVVVGISYVSNTGLLSPKSSDTTSTEDLNVAAVPASVATPITSNNCLEYPIDEKGGPAIICSKISPNTPASRVVMTNPTAITPQVVLGVFSLKSQIQASTINKITLTLAKVPNQFNGSIVSSFYIKYKNKVYGAAPGPADDILFTNIDIDLPLNQWSDFTLLADIRPAVNNVTVTSKLIAGPSTIAGIDASLNPVKVVSATSVSNKTRFDSSTIQVSNASAVLGTCFGGNQTYQNNTCPMTMSFTLINAGNTDVYVSKTPAIGLSTTTLVNGQPVQVASSSLSFISLTAQPGDTATSYSLPAGSMRQFTYTGQLSKSAAGGTQQFKITAIKYGPTAINGVADFFNDQITTPGTNAEKLITDGLANLSVTKVFSTLP